MPLIQGLLDAGAKVQAYDPEAMNVARAHLRLRRCTFADKSYDALNGADALAIVTEWNEFREPDFDAHAQADADAGDLRRPQHLQPGADAQRSASPTSRSAVTMSTRSRHRRRGLHRQPRRQGAAARRSTRSSSTTTSSPGHREARVRAGGALVEAATSATSSARARRR